MSARESTRADVIVLGGGPAGLATAGALARRGASVVVVERAPLSARRIGETLGAEVRPLLESLGAWSAVSDLLETQLPFTGVRSAWGGADLVDRSSIFHPLGSGWHVDRTSFDGRLADWAASEGADVRADVGTCEIARDGSAFRASSAKGGTIHAARLVDASGRGSPATSTLGGGSWLACDRQVAIAWWIDAPITTSHELLVEATEDGWWYAAPRPGGGLVVVLVTDADLVPAGGRTALPSRFAGALARTAHVSTLVGTLTPEDDLKVVRSDSGRLLPDRGDGLRAVGDAAMACDPLGGSGVARALRSAIEASEDLDAPADERALASSFDDYLDLRARYYTTETRFPDAPFWARRRPIAWRDARLELAPDEILSWSGEPEPHAEALLPPKAIATIREALASPSEAHVVLARVREVAPIGDRRLLVGLQELVASGAIRTGAVVAR